MCISCLLGGDHNATTKVMVGQFFVEKLLSDLKVESMFTGVYISPDSRHFVFTIEFLYPIEDRDTINNFISGLFDQLVEIGIKEGPPPIPDGCTAELLTRHQIDWKDGKMVFSIHY